MWDSLVSAASSVTNAVVTGTVGTGEKVPFSCQVPLKKFEETMTGADIYVELFRREAESLRNSPKWTPMDVTDPDGQDMKMWSQDQVGTYHFVKSTFSIKKADFKEVIGTLSSKDAETRKKFSADLAELEYFAETDDKKYALLRIAYNAPSPGTAGRDFVFLSGRNEKEHDGKPAVEVWGCSVDISSRPEDYNGYVRGACLYHWECQQDGENVSCIYTSCFDPRGWAPPALIAWFKSSATAEFSKLRAICSKESKAEQAAAQAAATE